VIVIQDIVWSGSVSRGGHTMCVLQWLHGLERLGFDVLFYDSVKDDFGDRRMEVVRAFSRIIERWWRPERTALIAESTGESLYGIGAADIRRLAAEAVGLVSVAVPGKREPPPLLRDVRPRIVVDHDPVYTQSWVRAGSDPADVYGEQDFYFTVASNVGAPGVQVETFGIDWRPIWNPVLLDWWPVTPPPARSRFTTVASWYGGRYVEIEGKLYGPKMEEWRRILDLPRTTGEEPELAMSLAQDDPQREVLAAHGWRIESPKRVATPDEYRDYIQASAGELSCVKGGYAGSGSGWFSDRSSCYLAAGRPVIVQSTGFERAIPTGEGLLSFSSLEEAAEAVRSVRADYGRHSRAARAIAAEHFDSRVTLAPLASLLG
jgi:hypothetical protein